MSEFKKEILCVCTGNICRSPMAEFLLRARLGENSGFTVCSAGVAAYAGGMASLQAIEALEEIGIDLNSFRSQPITSELVDSAGLIVVMTGSHKSEVLRRFPAASGKVFLITAFGTGNESPDIADPIGSPVIVYRGIRDELDSAISDLILDLKDKEYLENAG